MENWNKISEEVVEMLIKVGGMRPYDRISGKQIQEEGWGLGDDSLEEEEVNGLLLELIKDFDRIQIIGEEKLRYIKSFSMRDRSGYNIIKALYIDQYIADSNLSQFIKELWSWFENIVQNKLKVIEINNIIEKIKLKTVNTKEDLKLLGIREIKDFLIEVKNNLKILFDNFEKIFDIQKSDDEIENCYQNLINKRRSDYDLNTSEEIRNQLEKKFDQVYYNEFDRVRNYIRDQESKIKNACYGTNINLKKLYLDIKSLILEIHKKEYKFNIASLFIDKLSEHEEGEEEEETYLRQIYHLLIKLGANKDYIFKVAKELDKLGFNSNDWENFLDKRVPD